MNHDIKDRDPLDGKSVLVTGGTGSFGREMVATLLRRHNPAKATVFSRDELKQSDLRASLGKGAAGVRFLLGDVRDADRMREAMQGVDIVIHAAAMKQVPTCDEQPGEAVKTNIIGCMNIVRAAQDRSVEKVLALSTDKAASPISAYGATKLVAEKLITAANRDGEAPLFSSVRYGNVVGSRGSVVPIFLEQATTGTVTVTDPRMTRFCMTVQQSVDFVIRCLGAMQGGEVFVPKAATMSILDLAAAFAPGCAIRTVGVRPGERIHEVLISTDEARHTVECDDMYAILPERLNGEQRPYPGGRPLPDDFCYASNGPERRLSPEQLREVVGMPAAEEARSHAQSCA